MAYHGPTSIFNSNLTEPPSPMTSSTVSSQLSSSLCALRTPTIRLCIGLFFRWQYPQFMFIDRECFLQKFEEDATGIEPGFTPLIYAFCAMGAPMSPDPETRAKSTPFAEYSESMLKVDKLTAPSVNVVQALLVLAFYHVGRGNMSKGWMLSGIFSSMKLLVAPIADVRHHRARISDGTGAGLPTGSFTLGFVSRANQYAVFLLQQ